MCVNIKDEEGRSNIFLNYLYSKILSFWELLYFYFKDYFRYNLSIIIVSNVLV